MYFSLRLRPFVFKAAVKYCSLLIVLLIHLYITCSLLFPKGWALRRFARSEKLFPTEECLKIPLDVTGVMTNAEAYNVARDL